MNIAAKALAVSLLVLCPVHYVLAQFSGVTRDDGPKEIAPPESAGLLPYLFQLRGVQTIRCEKSAANSAEPKWVVEQVEGEVFSGGISVGQLTAASKWISSDPLFLEGVGSELTSQIVKRMKAPSPGTPDWVLYELRPTPGKPRIWIQQHTREGAIPSPWVYPCNDTIAGKRLRMFFVANLPVWRD